MCEIIRYETPVARKDYPCDVAPLIQECLQEKGFFSFSDMRIIALARQQGWKILKGTRYALQVQRIDGEFVNVRARQDLLEICREHELFEQ